jgi:hypothetical protein
MYLAGNSAALGGTEAPLVDIPRVDLRRTRDLVADTGGYNGPVRDEALDYITACLSQPKAKKRLPKKSVRTMDCPLDWDFGAIRSAYGEANEERFSQDYEGDGQFLWDVSPPLIHPSNITTDGKVIRSPSKRKCVKVGSPSKVKQATVVKGKRTQAKHCRRNSLTVKGGKRACRSSGSASDSSWSLSAKRCKSVPGQSAGSSSESSWSYEDDSVEDGSSIQDGTKDPGQDDLKKAAVPDSKL